MDKRDYWIITDEDDIIIGTAEVRAGALTEDDVLSPHADRLIKKAEKVLSTEYFLNYKNHGKKVIKL